MAARGSAAPPKLAERLLAGRLGVHRGDELLADLAEEYVERVEHDGGVQAGLWYWGQALRPAVSDLGRELGEVRTVKVGSHRAIGVGPLTRLGPFWRDLRTARRRLVRSPGFATATAVTLALGIGATVAIYSLVDGVVLRPLPYPEPDRLVTLAHTAGGSINGTLGQAYGTHVLYRDGAGSLDGIAFFQTFSATLTGDGEPERVEAASVTHTFFDLLRVRAPGGRTFLAEEDRAGGPLVVVISHDLWQRRFGGDPGLVGGTIEINNLLREVVGVMPPSFELPLPETDVWFPQQVDFAAAGFGGFYLSGIGRLADGATMESAAAELQTIVDRVGRTFPEAGDFLAEVDLRATVTPLRDRVLGGIEHTLWLILGGVGLVLLIACANVANLLLVRGEARSRELSLRRALGAGRGHLLGDSVAESLCLAALGGAGGLLIAWLGVAWLGRLASEYVPRLDQVSVSVPAVLVVTGIALLSCVVFGALPAVRGATASVVTTEGGRGATADRGRTRTRNALVVTQVALALLLLVGAGLLARSYRALQAIDPGFEASGVLTFELQLPGARYPRRADAAETIEQLRDRLEALPGVEAAGTIACLPLRGCTWGNRNSIAREDAPAPPGELPPSAWVNTTSPGYFRAMGIPLVAGRAFEAADHRDSTGAVVIDEAIAERFWPGEDPLGKRLYPSQTINEDGWYTVVGVVGSTRAREIMEEPEGMIYLPQVGTDDQAWWTTHQTTMTVRTNGDPLALVGGVRAAVADIDPDLALARVSPMQVVLDRATARSELAMLLLGLASVMALVLGLVGVYGVIAYVVSHRRGEIGVRMALGATARDVGAMVLGQAGRIGVLGVAIGLVAAFGLTRLMRAMLYGVAPTDPLTFLAVAVFLIAVTVAAAYIPARRASRVDPVETLRAD
ncbi:MAG: ADOP family duplicated permease [Gemmatimonadota bacterium]|nr:ADOP family duplicated permease [Gemmatimonadota bacterium]